MTQHPANARVAFDDAAEDELGGGERGVEQESVQRHEPVLTHGFDADGIRRMNHHHGAAVVRGFVQRPESLIVQAGAIDVREEHGARELELIRRAQELGHGRGGIAERQRRQRLEPAAPFVPHAGERVVRDGRPV
jgi:hypothetical protein